MLSLTYQGPWDLALAEREIPKIKSPNEVLIRVAATGICGTDLGITTGQYSATQGVILGHECAGTVIATGEDVKRVKTGDRVFVDPTFFCGQCDQCTSGHPNHCEEKSSTETGVSADGAFASHHVKNDRFVFPMGKETTFEAATLAEPFSCALTGVNQIAVHPDDRTIVLGAGPMGLMYAHALSLKGVRGTIVDVSQERLALAGKALPTGWKTANDFVGAVQQFKNERCDLVVDTTSGMTEKVLPHLNRGGKILLIGLSRHRAQIDPADLADRSISLVGSIDSIGTFPLACRLIDQGRLPWQQIITQTYALNDYAKAFAELGVDLTQKTATRTARQLKILLKTYDPA